MFLFYLAISLAEEMRQPQSRLMLVMKLRRFTSAPKTLVELGEASEDQIQMGWASSELHVRERLANALYLSGDATALQKGWSIELIGSREVSFGAPPVDNGTNHGNDFCSLGSY